MVSPAQKTKESSDVLEFPPVELKRRLHEKIVQMTKFLGKVPEDEKNKNSGYGYTSNKLMMSLLRDNLEVFKLEICPEVVDDITTEFQSKNGGLVRRVQVNMEFEVIDLETGYSEVKKWRGADQDSSGKEYQQAITTATKYFFFKLFKVSSKEEIDPDSKTTDNGGPPPHLRNSSPRDQQPGPPGGPPPHPRTGPPQGGDRQHPPNNQGAPPPNSTPSTQMTEEQKRAMQYLREFSKMGLLTSGERNRLNASDINGKVLIYNEVRPRIDELYADAIRNFDNLPENKRLEGLEYRETYALINYMADIGE